MALKNDTNYSTLETSVDYIYAGNGLDIFDSPEWIIKANFSRTQTDLVAVNKNGEKLIFVDFFKNQEPLSIETVNGLILKGSVVKILAGPVAPAQFTQLNNVEVLSIGEVSNLSGTAKAIRIDGTVNDLANGDPVFQGDTIEVSESGAVGFVFLDKTTLSLSEGGKMVLDELVYDPASGSGGMAVDMIEGAFSFVSGEIAKTGPDAMTVSTPVATIGIRGTTVAGKAAIEGNENSFTLLQDSDGAVGQISVSNAGGTQLLAQVGATTSITSFTAPPPPPIILSAAQIQANYGTALNVLPPPPLVAPTPQTAQASEEQQQEEQQQEETQDGVSEEETTEEVIEEEETPDGEEGPPDGEEGSPDGEEGPPDGEEGPPDGEEEGALSPEGGLLEDEEQLSEGSSEEVLTQDDEEVVPLDELSPVVGQDGELINEEGSPVVGDPPIGPDEEPLPPSDFGPGDDLTLEQDSAAREAFETALADGLTPEEAMAEAASVAGTQPPPPGGFIDDPLSATVGGENFAGGTISRGPSDLGSNSPVDFGSGVPGDTGDFTTEGLENTNIETAISSQVTPGTFLPPGSFQPPGTIQQPGAYIPAQVGFAPIAPVTSSPVIGSGFSADDGGGFYGEQGVNSIDSGGGISNTLAGGPGVPVGPGGFGGAGGGPLGSAGFVAGGPGIGPMSSGSFIGGPGGLPIGPAGGFAGGPGGGPIGSSFGAPVGPNYGGNSQAYNDTYYYEDSSVYENTSSNNSSNTNDSTSSGNSTTITGTNTADTLDYSSKTTSYTLKSASGADTLVGGSANDILFGGLGADTLTGNAGADKFYYTSGDGGDSITDFSTTDADTLVFQPTLNTNYSRTSVEIKNDNAPQGTGYNLSSNSNKLPYVFNFTTSNQNYDTESNVASTLSSFKITTDGSTAPASGEALMIITSDGTDSNIWLWEDTGNGSIESSELSSIANLLNVDNSDLTDTHFTNETLSI